MTILIAKGGVVARRRAHAEVAAMLERTGLAGVIGGDRIYDTVDDAIAEYETRGDGPRPHPLG